MEAYQVVSPVQLKMMVWFCRKRISREERQAGGQEGLQGIIKTHKNTEPEQKPIEAEREKQGSRTRPRSRP